MSNNFETFSERRGLQNTEPMHPECLSKEIREDIASTIDDLIVSERYIIQGYLENRDDGPLGIHYHNEYKQFLLRILWKTGNASRKRLPQEDQKIRATIENRILKSKFNIVLDILEIMINHPYLKENNKLDDFIFSIKEIFNQHNAAYWLDTTQCPYIFCPQISLEQGKAMKISFEIIHRSGMEGVKSHLRKAVEDINTQEYGPAIVESIKAVESVAYNISPDSNTLSQALGSLRNLGFFKHRAFAKASVKFVEASEKFTEASEKLSKAMSGFYGWTSNEPGLRHANKDKGSPNVASNEAIAMLGMCASYSAYLINRQKEIEEERSSAE